ncbi:hypothetical protein D8674_008484 [Pyrus ussuriensis x Pyrus communis]|uniref:Uncharacterized protein n=1 Tax=Pyrus ussuriensis x Pyrus communis TaxID=2448454 RepID=A0A5N5HSX5_9ROSA|nr:hypothetical protein D8674_008484 [Pyrus ussuriensis x Pyrus communis]
MSHLIRTWRPMTSTPSLTTTPTTAATTPVEMDHRPVNLVNPVGPLVPQAQASSTSSCPCTIDQMSPSGSTIDASSTWTWTGTCSRTSISSSPNATSSGRVTCTNVSSSLMIRRSLSRRVKKVKAKKINREKKTLLHHYGSRPFSYKMEAQWKIDIFADVYVWPGNKLTKSLHATMVEKSQLVLQEFTSQLPSDTPIKDVRPDFRSEARDLSGDGKC